MAPVGMPLRLPLYQSLPALSLANGSLSVGVSRDYFFICIVYILIYLFLYLSLLISFSLPLPLSPSLFLFSISFPLSLTTFHEHYQNARSANGVHSRLTHVHIHARHEHLTPLPHPAFQLVSRVSSYATPRSPVDFILQALPPVIGQRNCIEHQ